MGLNEEHVANARTPSYLVIEPNGSVRRGFDFDAYGDFIDAAVGVGGRVQVPTPPSPFAGWVNDIGLLNGMERNIVGGLMLVILGASVQPYAGPVVISGWDSSATARGEYEIRPLGRADILLADIDLIKAALAGGNGHPDGSDPAWPANVREVGRMMADMPVPPITITSIPRGKETQ